MFFTNSKRRPPTAEQVASIDNVVDVQASVVDDSFSPPPVPQKSGGLKFTKRSRASGPATEPKRSLFGFLKKPAQAAKPVAEQVRPAETVKPKRSWLNFARATKKVDSQAAVPEEAAQHSSPADCATDPVAPTPPVEPPAQAAEKPRKAPKAPKPPKEPKPAKPPKVPKASKRGPKGGVLLCLDVGTGSPAYWTVTERALAAVPAPAAGRALSFSPADHVVIADAPLGRSAASDLAIGELGEDAYIVNASKADGIVLATPRERTHGKALRLAPGVLALAALLRTRDKPAANCVVGFDLRGDDQHVLVLFVWGPDGLTADAGQVSVNPADVGFTVAQFAASRRLNAEDVRTVLFDNAELLTVANRVECYPNEASFLGMPVTLAVSITAAVASMAALGATAYALQQWEELGHARARSEKAAKSYKQWEGEVAALLESRAADFARSQSVDIGRAMGRASALWVPGTTLAMEAKLESESYDLTLPLQRGTPMGNRPNVSQALTPQELAALVDLSAPKDCTRTGIFVNGTLNEVQLSVTCENAAASFGRYRLD